MRYVREVEAVAVSEVLGPDGGSYKRGRRKIELPVTRPPFAARKMIIDALALSDAGSKVARRLSRVAENTYKVVSEDGRWSLYPPGSSTTVATTYDTQAEARGVAVMAVHEQARSGGTEAGIVECEGERSIHYPAVSDTVNLFAPFLVAAIGPSTIELRDTDKIIYAQFGLSSSEVGGLLQALHVGVDVVAYPLPEAPRPNDLVVQFRQVR